LRGADLTEADMSGVNLAESVIEGARMPLPTVKSRS
jgi:hypothetical protein